MLRSAAVFFIVLFVTVVTIALVSRGALAGPEVAVLRSLVLAAAVTFSVMTASLVDWLVRLTAVPPRARDQLVELQATAAPERPNVAEALRLAERPALAIVREFPPRLRAQDHSTFGGAPLAPPEFQWPRAGNGVPLTFMAQIDCAELPAFAERALLPESGVLYFFVGFEDGASAVVHLPGPAADWARHAPPADTPPIFGPASRSVTPWLGFGKAADQHLLRGFPAWPIRLAPVRTYAPDSPFDPETPEDAEFDRRGRELRLASLAAAFGPAVPSAVLQQTARPTRGRAWRPFEGFPQTWQAIEWSAGALAAAASELVAKGLSDWAPAQSDAEAWLGRARAQVAMAEPDEVARAAFWAWLDAVAAGVTADKNARPHPARLVDRALELIAALSVEASLLDGPESAAHVPAEVVALLRSRHHPLRRASATGDVHIGLAHQILGQPQLIRDSAYVDDHRLLLQLVWDPAMLWLFGDGGVCQFWAEEEDLRAGRFDRVTATFDTY